MNKQKRHAGRAIRKQRRRNKEIMAAFAAINNPKLWAGLIEGMAQIGKAAEFLGVVATEFSSEARKESHV